MIDERISFGLPWRSRCFRDVAVMPELGISRPNLYLAFDAIRIPKTVTRRKDQLKLLKSAIQL